MHHDRCRSCGAPVVFAVGESGRENPIEPEPKENGNVRLVEREGQKPLALYDKKDRQLTLEQMLDDDGTRYVSHFANCPDAPRWRKELGR